MYTYPEHEPNMVKLPATGNGMNSTDRYDTFLEVSGGFGNRGDDEVHLRMYDNDRQAFAQSWFRIEDLLAAIERVREDYND